MFIEVSLQRRFSLCTNIELFFVAWCFHLMSWYIFMMIRCGLYVGCRLIPISGSRLIFSIPNPGIGDPLIPGFQDYENEQNSGILHDIWPQILFSRFLGVGGVGQFPALKLRLDPNTNYVIMVDIVLRAQSC